MITILIAAAVINVCHHNEQSKVIAALKADWRLNVSYLLRSFLSFALVQFP